MSGESRSAEPNIELEKLKLKQTGKCETIRGSRSEYDKDQAVTKSGHPPRKRRAVHQLSNEKSGIGEKKRNYGLEAANVVQSLALQPKETTTKTEKNQGDLKQIVTSPGLGTAGASSELLQHQSEPEKDTKQAIVTAVQERQEPVVIKSLSSDSGPLIRSLQPEIERDLQHLLKHPGLFHEDLDRDTMLHLAIAHKNINLTLAIILAMVTRREENSNGINMQNKLRQSPLHLAVLTCQPVVVAFLIQNGADVNAIDRNGQTPLHLACKNADVEDIQAMRNATKDSKNSINVDLKNFEGLAPIHLASLTGSREVIEHLLDMGADIDKRDEKSGRTALHHAVEAQNPILTRFLLLKDANVNAQTLAGNTPLHTASGRRMENIVNILLEFGADRKLTNFEGDLPIPETYMPYSVVLQIAQKSKERKKN